MARFRALGLAVFLLMGCASADFIRLREGPVGMAHRPALEEVFVTPQSTRGDPVRIYVKASDPDGDLDRFVVSLEQLADLYPQEVILLPQGVKAISGYIDFLGTVPPPSQPIDELEVWVNVHAEDRAGNSSERRRLYLIISDHQVEQIPPPDGRFDLTRRLGWLREWLQTPESQVGDGDRDP
ncbi:MAG: hypothetical protein ACE5JJ_07350 [Nitrospinota bacterium]